MSRTFIATLAAAAVALTAFGAAPVRADEDFNRAVAAILGIAVVGKIIHDKNKRDKRKVTHERTVTGKIIEPHRPGRVKPHVQPRPLPRKVNKRLLPRNCFRTFQTRRGNSHGFGQHCLNNNYRFANSLPQHCLIRVRTNRGSGRAFEASCLRDAGYRLARG